MYTTCVYVLTCFIIIAYRIRYVYEYINNNKLQLLSPRTLDVEL